MFESHGNLIETDVLVIGAGAGGLLAALSAKRHAPPGTRVTIVDSWAVGRSGHTAFSNAWTVVVFPDEDLDAIHAEIIHGNDGIADQPLLREVLAGSYDQLQELEAAGLNFAKDESDQYLRRPTRGLDVTRVMCPDGGGLEFSWRLRLAIEEAGVQIVDRIFITGLMKGEGENVIGAVGVDSRSGAFHVLKARTTIMSTNAITFRSGFVRDITGTGTLLAYKAGATLRNAEFSYTRPSTPKFYFEGIAFAIQDGARFINEKGEKFMERYEPERGDRSDVPRIARAMALEKVAGNDPLYLDMSGIPPEKRDYYIRSNVAWMDYFFKKLGEEARTDMFGKTPYYPLNQMTKMGIATDPTCRSDVPGLLSAGLAQAGCANHFAGFHIGMCIGTGWISGRSAVEDLERFPEPKLDAAEIGALREGTFAPLDENAEAATDDILRELQTVMFSYDVSVWKQGDRLDDALSKVRALSNRFQDLRAPHNHELVRLKETEAMFLAAEMILQASLMRTESRLGHLREDYEARDDENWLDWIDISEVNGKLNLTRTPIPTPLVTIFDGSGASK